MVSDFFFLHRGRKVKPGMIRTFAQGINWGNKLGAQPLLRYNADSGLTNAINFADIFDRTGSFSVRTD
jgi:hypothetical protein